MRVLHSPAPPEVVETPMVLAAGFFDGVHLGHQSVIARCRAEAAEAGAESWVMTFDPHPLRVVQPGNAPLLLTSLSAKLDLLQQHGVDGCLVIPFTREFSRYSPEAFLAHLAGHFRRLRGMVIGQNWRFGRGAQGDVYRLQELARPHKLAITVAHPVAWRGASISSTRIRNAVTGGTLSDAEAMLGRPHFLRGPVIHGAKRGRRLGFPTANLDCTSFALPPSGIYAGYARVSGKRHPGAVYLPSAAHETPGILEVHLLDFDGDLYGQEIEVTFIDKIRDDNRRFTNQEDLIAQIQSDVVAIRGRLVE